MIAPRTATRARCIDANMPLRIGQPVQPVGLLALEGLVLPADARSATKNKVSRILTRDKMTVL